MSWYLIYTISEWVIRLVMLPVVTNRRKPDTAMAWLLVIFFQPIVGLVLFMAFGTRRLPLNWWRRERILADRLESEARRFVGHPNIIHPHVSPQLEMTVAMAERLGQFPILGGNKVEFLNETQEVVDRLVADIQAARHHVHMLFYIFRDDKTGMQVIQALSDAVRRGVKCRVLVDPVGSWSSLRSVAWRMQSAGIEFGETLPVGIFRRKMARVDIRNHRKLAVIDGTISYMGSQNIVDADYGHKDLAWHDLMVRLTGPITIELQAIFASDWHQETNEILTGAEFFPEPRAYGDVAAQTLPSGPSYPVENYQRLVVSAIHGARQRVIITTPYFVPDDPLLQAIQVAVLRGVAVDLIVPSRGDQVIVGAAARAYYTDVMEAGARLHLYPTGLLHSKTMTVDDSIALIGSSNFDIRSFAINLELNMLLYGAEVTSRLRYEQTAYLADSQQLDLESWQKRPRVHRMLDNIARLMSPLL